LTSFLGHELVILALLTLCGLLGGEAARRLRLPSVTGQILVGVLLGPSVFGLFSHETTVALTPIIDFALGLIAMAVGSHLHLPRLRTAMSRLGWLLACEAILPPALVFIAVMILGAGEWTFALLLGTLAVSTAPATIVAVVKETRSRGLFVSTLMAAVALNNIACITLFEMAFTAVSVTTEQTGGVSRVLIAPLLQVAGALVIGGAVGGLTALFTRHVYQPDRLATISLIALLIAVGAADAAGISALLSCLFLGAVLANLAHEKEEVGHRAFAAFEPAILAVFFTVAGLEFNMDYLAPAGALALAVIVARAVGKVAGAWLAMAVAKAPASLRDNLGLALIPQAGVAVALLLKVRESPLHDSVGELFLAVGVSTVMLNEVLGPVTARWALRRSGDLGKDRPRLIDFLHEHNIVTGFVASDKREAITRLVDLLVRTQPLGDVDRDALLAEVVKREGEMSTCVGQGLFLPHAEFEGVSQLVGVMAISEDGLPLETPDGRPVHCAALLVVPPHERKRHLEVLAAIARSVGSDPDIQTQLYHAHSPAHVWEILHAEEFEDYNYFLEEEPV
jgi:Kef-type K+ transport system membrane component KefB/mannitol/fructose-specific phosphotransferase system IIA component